MKASFLTLVVCFTLFIGCNAAKQEQNYKVVSSAEFAEQLQVNNIQLIDVRTPEEYAEGHIEGAVNIDFYDANFAYNLSQLNKKQPVLVYCKSGGRSGKASQYLLDNNFLEIYDLRGGINSWKKSGQEVIAEPNH